MQYFRNYFCFRYSSIAAELLNGDKLMIILSVMFFNFQQEMPGRFIILSGDRTYLFGIDD